MKPSDYIKKGWCQRAVAKTSIGIETKPRSNDAWSWCIVGAVLASCAGKRVGLSKKAKQEYFRKIEAIRDILGVVYLPTWNDDPDRTKAEVLEVLEHARL